MAWSRGTRILIRAHKHPFTPAGPRATLHRNLIGGNVGNLVFSQAAVRLLSVPGVTNDVSMLREPSTAIDADYDRVVLPLANAFRLGFTDQLGWLTERVEQLRVPVTVLGIGAQARLSGSYGGADRVDEPARRFVRAVLRRSPSIGVRGEHTRDYLRGLGFADDEVTVIGCPSMFAYGPDLPALRLPRELTAASRIALTVSPYVAQLGPVSLRCAERFPRSVYLAQNAPTLELLLTGRYPLQPREEAQLTSGVPIGRDHPLIASGRTRFPLEPNSWFAELAGYDFCFGSRIHGTISALLAGTPAVLLAHDARTLELARYHEIPYRKVPDDAAAADPDRLIANADWTGLHAGHADRWRVFADFLATHDLRHAYEPGGDRGAAFDAALAAIDFHPPVRPLTGPLPGPRYAARRAVTTAAKVYYRVGDR